MEGDEEGLEAAKDLENLKSKSGLKFKEIPTNTEYHVTIRRAIVGHRMSLRNPFQEAYRCPHCKYWIVGKPREEVTEKIGGEPPQKIVVKKTSCIRCGLFLGATVDHSPPHRFLRRGE